jgi:AAA family ATP:ADP antiporter
MRNSCIAYLETKLQLNRYDVIKLLLSGLAFFFVIGAYSILRSLKTSIFVAFIGVEYEPYAKVVSILVTIPTMLLYAKIIDRVKKHQAVYVVLAFYVALTICFAYLFTHPVYGVSNTEASPYRLVGWIFEIFMDLFQALIVGTFWSFVSSVSTPNFASKGYSLIVACSRVGGLLTTGISWLILESMPTFSSSILVVTIVAALFLAMALYCVYLLKQWIPQSHLHGYEAAYKVEQKNERSQKKTGVLEGLRIVLTEPYVLGIFWLVFSFEVINIIIDYQLHILMAAETNSHVISMSKFMLFYTGTFQALGLLFALFGTSQMIRRFGVQKCLLVMPIVTIFLSLLLVIFPKLTTLFAVMVVMRGLNYGFNDPLREILFIPTVKDIQFKSKAWIGSFGRTIAKTSGSSLNILATQAPHFIIAIQSAFSITLALAWAVVGILVGRKYLKTIASNAVIGEEKRVGTE